MRRTRAHLRGKDVGGRICAGSERHREQLVRHLPRLGTPLEALEPRVRLPDLRRRLRTESRAELVDHPESGVVHCLHLILETRRKKISALQASAGVGAATCVSTGTHVLCLLDAASHIAQKRLACRPGSDFRESL